MNHFVVNGKEHDVSNLANQTVGQLLARINTDYTNVNSMVTSISIDGVVVDASLEERFSQTPLESIQSVEVSTSHPREFVEDTLQTLIKFSDRLIQISEGLAMQLENGVTDVSFERLIEGLEVFTDTLTCAKNLLGVGMIPKVQVLEADLASILRDLTHAREHAQLGFQVELLRDHLIENLQEWKELGIPTLIRSRDS